MGLAPFQFSSDSVHKFANVLSFSIDSAWIGCSIGRSSNNPLNQSNMNDVHDFSALIECWISVCTVDIYGRIRALYSCAKGTRKSIWIQPNKRHKFDFWANAFDSHGQSANESCWILDHTLNRRKCLAALNYRQLFVWEYLCCHCLLLHRREYRHSSQNRSSFQFLVSICRYLMRWQLVSSIVLHTHVQCRLVRDAHHRLQSLSCTLLSPRIRLRPNQWNWLDCLTWWFPWFRNYCYCCSRHSMFQLGPCLALCCHCIHAISFRQCLWKIVRIIDRMCLRWFAAIESEIVQRHWCVDR